MYEIKDDKELLGYCFNIIGPVEVTLNENYKPGKDGNPTIEEFDSALRNELSDFLEPNHPIIFKEPEEE